MIIDSHVHVFRVWPWQPMEHKVAYPNSRGIREVPRTTTTTSLSVRGVTRTGSYTLLTSMATGARRTMRQVLPNVLRVQ